MIRHFEIGKMLCLSGVLVFIAYSCSVIFSPPAKAFWKIWTKVESKGGAEKVGMREVRESGCATRESVRVFGENAFMRRQTNRSYLSRDYSRAVAAAYIAETTTVAELLLLPLINSGDARIASAGRLSLAFVHLRRTNPSSGQSGMVVELLAQPMVGKLESDRRYLLATLALARSRWSDVERQSAIALKQSPTYYNARVLYSLARMQALGSAGQQSCANLTRKMEALLLPLLRLGACPPHVAHFDLAAERYLNQSTSRSGSRVRLLRRAYLAYVSKNDLFFAKLAETYRHTFGQDRCYGRLSQLNFGATASSTGRDN